jgi:hypothetical protein
MVRFVLLEEQIDDEGDVQNTIRDMLVTKSPFKFNKLDNQTG